MKGKARLLPRGFDQHLGVDFNLTVTPIIIQSSMCLMAVIACELQLDFVHVNAQEEFFQPD